MYSVKITDSMNLVDLFWGIWKISLAKYTGCVCRDKEHQVTSCHGAGVQGPTLLPRLWWTQRSPTSPTCSR